MTKILCIGDPHFRVDNIVEVNLFINKIEKLAEERKPDIIICLGDLLHTHERVHTIPLNKAYEFIDRMRKIAFTYVLVGNHDFIQNQQFLTENHWMNGMKEWENVCIVDKVIEFENFIMLPYVPNGKFIEALDESGLKWKKARCIFAHQEFAGCKMGAIISIDGDKWDEKYPHVVSGHIHSKQRPQKNIYYTGSAMQHAFGESEENIIPILTFSEENNDYDLEEIDLGMPRKKIVYADIDDVEKVKGGDNIKVTLSGNYDEFKSFKKTEKYKELSKSGAKIVFKGRRKEDKKLIERTGDFKEILYDLILGEKDSNMLEFYELLINNKKISSDDYLIID